MSDSSDSSQTIEEQQEENAIVSQLSDQKRRKVSDVENALKRLRAVEALTPAQKSEFLLSNQGNNFISTLQSIQFQEDHVAQVALGEGEQATLQLIAQTLADEESDATEEIVENSVFVDTVEPYVKQLMEEIRDTQSRERDAQRGDRNAAPPHPPIDLELVTDEERSEQMVQSFLSCQTDIDSTKTKSLRLNIFLGFQAMFLCKVFGKNEIDEALKPLNSKKLSWSTLIRRAIPLAKLYYDYPGFADCQQSMSALCSMQKLVREYLSKLQPGCDAALRASAAALFKTPSQSFRHGLIDHDEFSKLLACVGKRNKPQGALTDEQARKADERAAQFRAAVQAYAEKRKAVSDAEMEARRVAAADERRAIVRASPEPPQESPRASRRHESIQVDDDDDDDDDDDEEDVAVASTSRRKRKSTPRKRAVGPAQRTGKTAPTGLAVPLSQQLRPRRSVAATSSSGVTASASTTDKLAAIRRLTRPQQ